MRCLGRTRTLQRCKNNARIIVCHKHRFEPWFAFVGVVSFFGVVAGIYQDAWKPMFGDNSTSITQIALDDIIQSRDELQEAYNGAERQSHSLPLVSRRPVGRLWLWRRKTP